MELKKITLSGEKQLSEKQQSLSRFITMHTGLPFTGKTYNEWQMWVDLNKDYAETIATEKLSKNEKHRKRNQRTRQNSQMVKMDYAALKAIAKKSNKTMTGANYALGQGKSYLANRHSAYDDMILADDAGTLAEFFGCDPAEFIPELQLPDETQEALDLIEQAQITSTYETSTIDDAEGKPIVEVQKPVAMDRTIVLRNPITAVEWETVDGKEIAEAILKALGMTIEEFYKYAFGKALTECASMTVPELRRLRTQEEDNDAD